MRSLIDIPIKKKTKLYLKILIITFLVLKIPDIYWNYQFSHLDRAKNNYFVRTNVAKINAVPLELQSAFLPMKEFRVITYRIPPDYSNINLNPLKKIPGLAALIVDGHSQTEFDFDIINYKKGLRYVDIEGTNYPSDKKLIISNRDLRYLNFSNLKLNTLVFAQNLDIKFLTLHKLTIVNLIGIENLSKLKILDLSNTGISDISALKNLSKLEKLNIIGNNVTDFSALKSLKSLKSLSINIREDSSFLKDLKSLKKLNLWYCSPTIHINDLEEEYEKVRALEKQLKKITKYLPNCQVYSNFTPRDGF